MESFKLVSTENLETTNENNKIGEENTRSPEHLLNENFHETLMNKIKQEVKNAIKAETSNTMTSVNVRETNIKHANDLVNILLSQITFLKDELKSKDYIIKMLLNDRVSATPTMESTVKSSIAGTEHQNINTSGDKFNLGSR